MPRWLGTTRVARLGYRPSAARHDFASPRPAGIELLRRTTASTPGGIEDLLGDGFDQGQSAACTAASIAKALRASLQRGGEVLPWEDFSPHFGYGSTRDVERAAGFSAHGSFLPDLEDGGAIPDDGIRAAELYGVKGFGQISPDGRYFDIWTSADTRSSNPNMAPNVNDEPDLAGSEVAAQHVTTGAHDINVAASDLDAQLAALPTRGIGSCLALFVGESVFNWNPDRGPITKIDLRDPSGGGHQVCGPTRTYVSPTFGLVIRFLNSWGPGWGMNGYGEITYTALRSTLDAVLAFDSRWRTAAARIA